MSNKESEVYTFEKKKKLAVRIGNMRDKQALRKIKDIILTENPGIGVKKSQSGYLMYFQNYTDETYKKLEKYLNKLELEKLEKQARSITETSELILSSEDPSNYTLSRTRLRYSNNEKRLIKRQQYEDIINETNETIDTEKQESDNLSDKIVVKKTTKQASKQTAKKSIKTDKIDKTELPVLDSQPVKKTKKTNTIFTKVTN